MKNLKNVLALIVLTIVLYSCTTDDVTAEETPKELNVETINPLAKGGDTGDDEDADLDDEG